MYRATAAVVESAGEAFTLTDVELDEPHPHEVVVRITATGMCHTDLSAQTGYIPFPLAGVLGHEGAGVVECVGSAVSKVAIGDKVLISFASCGNCRACETGRPVKCERWEVLNLHGGCRLDGSATIWRRGRKDSDLHGHFFGQSSFSTVALTHERNVVVVPAAMALETLAPFGCGVQTGAGAIFNVLTPRPGATLAVYGAGAVGLSAIMAAHLLPLDHVIAVDVNETRLALARSLGATETVNSHQVDPVGAIGEIVGGGGVQHTLETSGSTKVLRQAIDSLGIDGTCGIVGAPPRGSEVAIDVNRSIARGLRIIGINEGDAVPHELLPKLIKLHQRGLLPVDRLTVHFPFEDIEKAAAAARAGEVIKPVLTMAHT